jgi:FtsZ-interacting cell division protein ZipA
MTDLTMAYKRVQDLVDIFKSYNYTFVELEQLCEQIKEKIDRKEQERIERERREQESRERMYAAERVREERRVRNEKKREEYRRKEREHKITVDYHDTNKKSAKVQDAIMSGDQDAIMKMLFSFS